MRSYNKLIGKPFWTRVRGTCAIALTCLWDRPLYTDIWEQTKELAWPLWVLWARVIATILFPLTAGILMYAMYVQTKKKKPE